MQEFGKVSPRGDSVTVSGDNDQLYSWAHRSGATWPCSALARYDLVAATLDSIGDLVDLRVIEDGQDSDADDLGSDELTAWIDDNLAASPFAHLQRNPVQS